MAERIAHRELRNRSGAVLREVAAGATYEITNRGEVVAVLTPPAGSAAGHARMRVRPARERGGFSALTRVRRDRTSAEVVADLRAER